jgi:hypothetical protein
MLIGCDDDAAPATGPSAPNAVVATGTSSADKKALKDKGDARIVSATGDIPVARAVDRRGRVLIHVAGER